MPSVTIQVEFNAILEQKSASLVVAYFYSKGYVYCESMDQILERAQKKFEYVTFVHVDANSAHSLSEEYVLHKVTTIPTCLFFKDKNVVDRYQGVEEDEIEKLLEKHAVTEPQKPSDEPSDISSEEASVPAPSPAPSNFSQGFLQSLWNPEMLKGLHSSYLPPKNMLNDIHTQLSIAFGLGTQNRAARCDKDKPISEPTLILYCPLEGGEYGIDATVQALAERFNADVQVLDVSQLAIEQWGSVWADIARPQNLTEDSSCSCSSCKPPEAGYFSRYSDPDAEKLKELTEELLNPISNPRAKTNGSEKRPRILYIRDFGMVATLVPTLYRAILLAVQKGLPGSSVEGVDPVPTAIVLGNSPLLKKSSLFQKASNSESKLDAWGEGDDAQEVREQRIQKQYEMWKDGSLSRHVEEQLSATKVFTDISRSSNSRYKYSRTCIVVPETRDLGKERIARETTRLNINQLQMRTALFADGVELSTGPAESPEVQVFTELCRDKILALDVIHSAADRAIGTATKETTSQDPKLSVTWTNLSNAWETQKDLDEERSDWIKNSTSKDSDDQNMVDDLVEKVKSMDLGRYERDMLRCLIKPGQLQTTFDSVHLPIETIDAVRSLVSLQLICPEAFQTGLLKEYNMTGALFFGPPGTGKTHLARAIAKESGARMISYVGESEKIISGLFQLARRLKPCIVFIDEIDSLFGARTSNSNCPWRTDMLTQFAQEMDGMHTSDVVVIGTTNRPFDLDDAMVRRLPCRVLIDLPDETAREAILRILLRNEQLESDIDLKTLARQTPRFSGSDLKSLCVMAAYESAKESAKIPWSTGKPQADPSPLDKLSSLGTLTPALSDSGTASPTGGVVDKSESPAAGSDVQESEPTTTTPKPRTLSKRHFTHALSQVRASTSESQDSFVQLRKWNDQFGSANQKKKVDLDAIRNQHLPYTERGSYLRQLGVV